MAQITPSGSTQRDPQRSGDAAALNGTPVAAAGEGGGPASGGDPEGDAPEEGGFLAGTLAELRRVVWPSRQQLFSESLAVILMVAVTAASIAGLDRFYRWVSLQVFR